MTAKTALKGASKRPLVGKYQKLICARGKRLLNAGKRVFFGGAGNYENAK